MYRYNSIMYEQKFYLSIENINFCICVFPIILPKKNAQILKGVLSWGDILLINPRENRENFTPAQLEIYGFQDMFTVD